MILAAVLGITTMEFSQWGTTDTAVGVVVAKGQRVDDSSQLCKRCLCKPVHYLTLIVVNVHCRYQPGMRKTMCRVPAVLTEKIAHFLLAGARDT